MDRKQIYQELFNYGINKFIEYKKNIEDLKIDKFLNKESNDDIIYNKTHKIINLYNINKYHYEYPLKINLHLTFKDIKEQLRNIKIATNSAIVYNKEEFNYYINMYLSQKNNEFQYLQSNLENNWNLEKINLIIYNKFKDKKNYQYLKIYKNLFIKYNKYFEYLYILFSKINNKNDIKLLIFNKYIIYERFINQIFEILKLKPIKYKAIIIFKRKNTSLMLIYKNTLLMLKYKNTSLILKYNIKILNIKNIRKSPILIRIIENYTKNIWKKLFYKIIFSLLSILNNNLINNNDIILNVNSMQQTGTIFLISLGMVTGCIWIINKVITDDILDQINLKESEFQYNYNKKNILNDQEVIKSFKKYKEFKRNVEINSFIKYSVIIFSIFPLYLIYHIVGEYQIEVDKYNNKKANEMAKLIKKINIPL